jgi:precorrin-3B synthase
VALAAGPHTRSQRERHALDACPGVLRLHAAADGQLARVRLPGGRLDARALAALADGASLGNDIVELTSRAGLQLRGLGDGCGEELAGILASGGLLPSLAHDRVRNILAAPLAGRGPAAVREIDGVLDALDRALCADAALAELPGRFLFALDDGTRALDPIRADVELAAEGEGFRVRLDGRPTSLVVGPREAPEAALRAARAFLDVRREQAPDAWRVADVEDGARRVAAALGVGTIANSASAGRPPAGRPPAGRPPAGRPPAGRPPASRPSTGRPPMGRQPTSSGSGAGRSGGARRLGPHVQRDGLFAVSVLAPLARLDAEQLARLSALAGVHSPAGVRVSPWRTLTLVDVPCAAVAHLIGELQAIGLVADDGSGWRGLSACAGLGACARARADIRAAAAERVPLRDRCSPSEHWSACERRCGEPADVAVSVVAGEQGFEVERR